jgi:protein involved in polysaccharide export with SLBB domain
MGNFLAAREDGLNPDYVIMPGDRVAVNTWGAIDMSQVFVVDAQGNIFMPGVGPVHVASTPNAQLTAKVREGLNRVYARHFDVYTNLLTAKPVAVFVTGGVERPGRYAGVPSDSVLFFLDQAGGIDANLGSYRKISVLREGKPVAQVDLYDFLLRGNLPTVQFEDGDTILVHQRAAVVELTGTVTMPALLEFPKGAISGTDALAVIPGAARVTQVTVQGIRRGVPITRTLTIAAFKGFQLQDGDSILLRDDGRADTILVHLEGEFHGPSVLAVQRGSRLVDVLNYVPIDPALADPRAVHIRRASVIKDQKDSINDSLFRLERSALLALSQSQGEAAIRVQEAELTLKFVERARLIQPLGRVVTARDQKQRNIVLEAGDIIVVPTRTNVVRISGEVMMSQAVMFRPGATAEDYIEDAGGYSDRGDDDRVIVIHSNAEVAIASPGVEILPGDEILVPPRVDSKVLQNTVDVTQIIYQVAVSAAVIIAIL